MNIEAKRHFAVVNESRHLSHTDLTWLSRGLRSQMRGEFSKKWHVRPSPVIAYDSLRSLPTDLLYDPIVIVDEPTGFEPAIGVLGQHSYFASMSYSVVFVEPILDLGGGILSPKNSGELTVSGVASHEMIESKIDPRVNLWMDGPRIDEGDQYALEPCDPTQNEYEKKIYSIWGSKTVNLCNFVTPAWYDETSINIPGASFDHLGHVKKPFEILDGGYSIVRDSETKQVSSVNSWGAKAPTISAASIEKKRHRSSRTARRGCEI